MAAGTTRRQDAGTVTRFIGAGQPPALVATEGIETVLDMRLADLFKAIIFESKQIHDDERMFLIRDGEPH